VLCYDGLNAAIFFVVNSLYLVFHWSQLQLMYSSVLQDEVHAVDKLQSVQVADKSLLQLSLEQENGSGVSRKFRHPCLRRIYFLVASLVSEIGAAFQELRLVDDNTCDAVMQHFSWLRFFVRVCQQRIGCRSSRECISEIAVHWHWLHRKLIASLCGIGFQFSPQLTEAMRQLEKFFGIDEAAVKIQGNVRSLLGQPHPFRSSAVAEAFNAAYLLCCRLECKTDSNGVDSIQINLRSDVQTVKIRLANSLVSLDLDTVEVCIAETTNLSNIVATPCDVENTQLSARVALYPLCQLLADAREAEFVADICNDSAPLSAEVVRFITFSSQCAVMSPLTLCSLKFMLSSSAVGLFHVSRSLLMRSITSQLQGASSPAVYSSLLCCNVSDQILSLLCALDGPPKSYSTFACLPGDVTLGDGDSRCLRLSCLNRLMWNNAQLLCNLKSTMYENDCRLLHGTFHNLISSLQSVLPSELSNVIGSDAEMYADASEMVSAADATSSNLMMLIPDWPSRLGRCLQQIGRLCSRDDDHSHAIATLGAAWVEVGMFKMRLLAARGPVDPGYRLAVKLKYATEQLQCCERNLKAHNWQATLSTGQQLSADSHPMVNQMYLQHAKLSKWMCVKSKLVAYRPELACYLALVRDVQQFMFGIGSSERIRDLVERLLKSSECDFSAVDAMEEYTAFRAAVSAFMSRVERDYLLYCDIVTPFLAAVAEAMHGVDLVVSSVRTATSRRKLYSALHSRDGVLDDFVRCIVQFPVSCENLKSGSWRAICEINFDSLLKSETTFENVIPSTQLRLRYVSLYIFCSDVINEINAFVL